MNPDNYQKRYFWLAVIMTSIAMLIAAGGAAVRAWTNPTDNPPGGTAAVNVDSSGRVGIGTASPGKDLVIERNTPDVWLQLNNTSAVGRKWNLISSGSGSGNPAGSFGVQDETEGVTRLLIDSLGNVGIGTGGPPGTKLEIAGVTSSTEVLVDEARLYGTTKDSAGALNIISKGDLIWLRPNSKLGPAQNPRLIAGGLNGNAALELRDEKDAATVFVGAANTQATYFNAGNVGIGLTNPNRPLVVDSAHNSAASGAASVVVQGVSNKERFEARSFGLTPGPSLQGIGAHGTPDVPSATAVGDNLLILAGGGYQNAVPSAWTGNKVIIRMKAAENFTTAAQGTQIMFETTGLGSTSRLERMRISPNGNVGIGSTRPSALLTLGSAIARTNGAVTLLAQDVQSLGTSAGNTVYPFEFRSKSDNDNRLLLMNYRRSAGSDWQSSGWRLQTAVDDDYTAPDTGLAYLEFYNNNGGELYLGTAGSDRLRIDSAGNLSVYSKRIMDVAAPVAGGDAANKNYVDSQTGGSQTTVIWGEGRKNTGVHDSGGECTVNSVKVSRSTTNASWDGSAAACPKGWWVCSENDRGSGSCGPVKDYRWVNCDPSADIDEYTTGFTANAWVSDAQTGGEAYQGRVVSRTGPAANQSSCSIMPVWCCAL